MSARILRLLSGLGAITVVLVAIMIQVQSNLEPCPLCIFQRIFFLGYGVLSLALAIVNPNIFVRKIVDAIILFFGLIGGAIAARHVWLTHLPKDVVPPCGPPWDIMVDEFPLKDLILTTLQGSGDCANVDWTFLYLSMPAWSLIIFILLSVVALRNFLRN